MDFQAHLAQMAGGQDIRGMQIVHNIRVIGKLFDVAVARSPEFGELSGPRLGILLRLYGEEERGNTAGITPTALSHFQDVKKTTISALLKGLEEGGLIERSPQPGDGRASLVRITPTGRELVRSTAPLRFGLMDQMTAELTDNERDTLIELLHRLRDSLNVHINSIPSPDR